MKTKIKKDWHGRTKSVEELHKDSRFWLSEIEFFNDEIHFLDNLIGSRYIECLDAGLSKNMNALTERLAHEKQASRILYNSVRDHEIILDGLIRANSVSGNTHYLNTHHMLEKEMEQFMHDYKQVKMEIFETIEKVLEKKERKKLVGK